MPARIPTFYVMTSDKPHRLGTLKKTRRFIDGTTFCGKRVGARSTATKAEITRLGCRVCFPRK